MVVTIALLVSVILQLGALIVAFSLIKRTKYNISWIMFTIAFLLMAIRRIFEFDLIMNQNSLAGINLINTWIGVVVSVLMFLGVLFIRKIFDLQARIDRIRKDNEAKVLTAIIQTEEKSRQKFAKELHDGLGPILSSIKMSVSALDKSVIGEFNAKIAVSTENAIDQAINTVKEISNNLSPHILNNHGLHKSIETFINTFNSTPNFSIIFSSNIANQRFHYSVEIVVYRIICELISNSAKHAHATKVEINLFKKENMLEIFFSDNGIGFDLSKILETSPGMGLPNINSRVRSLGGTIEFLSEKKQGIDVKIKIPL
ncbi:MAG: ATP-binding protein [Bacteroidales bacterium]